MAPIAYRDGETELRGRQVRPSGPPKGAVVVFPSILTTALPATDPSARASSSATATPNRWSRANKSARFRRRWMRRGRIGTSTCIQA